MFKYIFIPIAISLLLSTSCTKVIDVDVPEAEPRLVIEASINWKKGTTGETQTIKLSKSTPYFSENQNIEVTNAIVSVTDNTTNQVFDFVDQNNGDYICENFVPIINRSYTLNINAEGENYTAEERLKSVSGIARIDQSVDGGFDDEAIELNLYIQDPPNEVNFYMIKTFERGDLLPEVFDVKDEFFDGNEIKLFWEKMDDDDTNEEEFEPGDIVDIELYGISEAFYNYIKILVEQTQSGDPFSTVPVALKGNCINSSNPDKAPYGFFRLSQYDEMNYTVQ
ncbi:DUF4249 domain-containing protein [Marinifilum sp.]|uniref:DUF4249 domain-containing protein n=1 Tax=Marinifilum sp. TaxID=2033137 RepID=UPI003BA88582